LRLASEHGNTDQGGGRGGLKPRGKKKERKRGAECSGQKRHKKRGKFTYRDKGGGGKNTEEQ